MTDLEYDIIEELCFVTPYSDLKQQVEADEENLIHCLKILMQKEWVQQLEYHSERKDFFKCKLVNESEIPLYAYLATKKALLIHNGL